MKIICISDTHNKYQMLDGRLPNGDILIHAGDLVSHGTVEEIQNFINWYSKQPHEYKIFVGGNHDGALEHSKERITIPNNLIYLENEQIIINGLKIWGSPVSPPFRSFGFMWDEEKRESLYKKIPENCDIIINHSPPFGTLDTVLEGMQVGCKYLAENISRIKPKVVICGHIHESYGYILKEGILYINPSIMTRWYQPTNSPIIVEYNEDTQEFIIQSNL